MQEQKQIEGKVVDQVERVAGIAERVGIPTATFVIGAVTLILSQGIGKHVDILPWLGTFLIIAALAMYVWLTSRSTVRVQTRLSG